MKPQGEPLPRRWNAVVLIGYLLCAIGHAFRKAGEGLLARAGVRATSPYDGDPAETIPQWAVLAWLVAVAGAALLVFGGYRLVYP
jgi:hypothetical protein